MQSCEINITGKASKQITADRYQMGIALYACAKDAETVATIQTMFVKHVTDIVKSNENNNITVVNVSFTSDRDKVKKMGFITTATSSNAVRCNTVIDVCNIQDIIGNLAALFNNYREKTDKDTSIKITSCGNWKFSRELIDKTELNLYGAAYADAITKANCIIDAMKHGATNIDNIVDRFVTIEVGDGVKQRNSVGRVYMRAASLDGEMMTKQARISNIDTDESMDITVGEPEEDVITMELQVKLAKIDG